MPSIFITCLSSLLCLSHVSVSLLFLLVIDSQVWIPVLVRTAFISGIDDITCSCVIAQVSILAVARFDRRSYSDHGEDDLRVQIHFMQMSQVNGEFSWNFFITFFFLFSFWFYNLFCCFYTSDACAISQETQRHTISIQASKSDTGSVDWQTVNRDETMLTAKQENKPGQHRNKKQDLSESNVLLSFLLHHP